MFFLKFNWDVYWSPVLDPEKLFDGLFVEKRITLLF